jgi:hypothetical protein
MGRRKIRTISNESQNNLAIDKNTKQSIQRSQYLVSAREMKVLNTTAHCRARRGRREGRILISNNNR